MNKKIAWLLIVVTYFLSYIIVENKYEIYIFMSLTMVLLLVYTVENKGIVKIYFTLYHIHLLLFCLFCYLSSTWSVYKDLAIGKGNTLLEILLLTTAVFYCANRENAVDFLLKAVMWGGFCVSFYVIFYYGAGGIFNVFREHVRIDSTLINANSLGICSAYSLLISLYYIIYDKTHLWNIVMIPSIIMLAASGSRKAILMVIGGTFILFTLKNIDKRNVVRGMLRIVLAVFLILIVFIFLSRLSIFEEVKIRMAGMLSTILGRGAADSSTVTRLRLIEIGMDVFKEHPFIGLGIDNTSILAAGIFNKESYYLHNNFVEMLANGGIVGFALYYFFYVYVLGGMIKYRDFNDKEYNICLTLLLLVLIMDYGVVSYLNKGIYIFKIIFLFQLKKLRKNKGEMRYYEYSKKGEEYI
jgi:Lipid A core - O-antigen ligase and related enzymes